MININKNINDDNDLNTKEILRYNNYEFWFTVVTFQFVQVQVGPLQPLQLWRELLSLSVQELVDYDALDLGYVWVGDAWTTYQWIQENRQISTEADSSYMSRTYSGPPGWLLTAPSEFPLAFFALLLMFKLVMLLFMF
jgi:hypothetical protein